jgi:8-oxo-dGTP pyrophosphatase MutT (NUDIX family)
LYINIKEIINMCEILRVDLHNYNENWPVHRRTAAKAVFFVDSKLAMQQTKIGDVKFIGGGLESGESLTDCLIREVKEESGYDVIPESIREIGLVTERRKDKFQDSIYEMTIYMFSCEVDTETRCDMSLTPTELDWGMSCVLITPEQAIATNEAVLANSEYKDWAYRDLSLLKLLFKNEAE